MATPLPVPPADFGQPVARPIPHRGEDARAYSARALGSLDTANQRLVNDNDFYTDVQRRFGGGQ